MAHVEVPYGSGTLELTLPDPNLIGVLEGKAAPVIDLEEAFDQAWRNPIGIKDPAEIIRPGEKVVFIVTDHTRPTPTRRIFPLLWERICGKVCPEDVTLLVGTGTHRAPTDEELKQMLGELRRKFHVSIHDCDRDLVRVGESSRGIPIYVNRLVTEADRVVTIGHIGMHFYAGYTGGRKNILPGVAGRETIEANHAQLTDPRCEGCVYEGNPISEEMSEAARLAGIDYIVDVVLDSHGQVTKVVIGDVEEAHAAGRAFWDTLHQIEVSARADLVIVSAGGHPHDINLYQAYKGLYNAAKIVKDGGMILWIAACPDSIGHSVFSEWMLRCCDLPDEVFGILQREGFKLGGHKAFYLAKNLQRAEIHLYSEMEGELVRRFFLKPASDPNDIVSIARKQFGEEFRILVMPNGGATFPILDGDASL